MYKASHKALEINRIVSDRGDALHHFPNIYMAECLNNRKGPIQGLRKTLKPKTFTAQSTDRVVYNRAENNGRLVAGQDDRPNQC